MSSPERDALEACESAIRAIDSSLSVLVIARENVLMQMERLVKVRPNPTATMGQPPPEVCDHPEGARLALQGGSAELCELCGEQVT
jgi:hypothetical protein